jgi:cell division protein FtsN
MRLDERAEFLRTWQLVANGLAAISALLDELPETLRPMLLQLLHKLKSSQIRRYHQFEQVALTPVGIEDAIEQQRALAMEVANFIDVARDECARARARRSTALVPGAGRQGDWENHEFHRFREQVLASIDELHSVGQRPAVPVQSLPTHYRQTATPMPFPPLRGATPLCGMCHQPVQTVYFAPFPPGHVNLLGGPAQSDAGHHRGVEVSKASNRRPNAAESLASSIMKAIGGAGMLLAVVVIVAAVASRSTRPIGHPVAHEQDDRDAPRIATVEDIRSTTGEQKKPFVDRLESMPGSVPVAVAQAPSRAPPSAGNLTSNDGGVSSETAVSSRAGPKGPALAGDETAEIDRDVRQPRPTAKSVAAANSQAPASILGRQKVAETPTPRPPVSVMRAVAKSPVAEDSDKADNLYVAVLSTHKEAGAARDEFAELQKKYAAILGSKQSEVQVTTGQTGSWYRLVVTPASTKTAVNQICNDLRSAGYARCWVKPY